MFRGRLPSQRAQVITVLCSHHCQLRILRYGFKIMIDKDDLSAGITLLCDKIAFRENETRRRTARIASRKIYSRRPYQCLTRKKLRIPSKCEH